MRWGTLYQVNPCSKIWMFVFKECLRHRVWPLTQKNQVYQVFLEQQWFLKNRTNSLSNRGSRSYFDLVVPFSITQIHSSIGKNFVTLFPTRTSVFWKKNFIANSFLKSSSHKTLFIETYSRTVPLTYDHGFHPTSGSKFQIQYSRKNYCQKFFIFMIFIWDILEIILF